MSPVYLVAVVRGMDTADAPIYLSSSRWGRRGRLDELGEDLVGLDERFLAPDVEPGSRHLPGADL